MWWHWGEKKIIGFLQEELSQKELHPQLDSVKQKDYHDEQLQVPTSEDDCIRGNIEYYKQEFKGL